MIRLASHWKFLTAIVLSIATFLMWHAVWNEWPKNYFTVAFLDIGQGDAIYIESPTHSKIIVDGGPPHALLGALRKVMPFYDRSIDAVVVTNPDTDHYAGFIDLFDRYNIGKVFEPGTHSDTKTFAEFEKRIHEKNIETLIAQRGMVLHLGSSTDLTILYPDRDVSNYATNNGSIVAKLSYGSSSVMLTGDAPSTVLEYVLQINGTSTIRSTLLKAGHHGSRTSASPLFTEAVHPEFAIISAGLNNSYGHPHKETMDLFSELHIPTLITFEEGTIIFHCTVTSCSRQ
jgi:competence protein ComEC